MTDREIARETETDIPPALTANEWANITKLTGDALRRYVDLSQEVGRSHAAIAILNDELHGEDPRKLTREHVSALRAAAEIVERQIPPMPVVGEQTQDVFDRVAREAELYSQLRELADVLESYLPPSEA